VRWIGGDQEQAQKQAQELEQEQGQELELGTGAGTGARARAGTTQNEYEKNEAGAGAGAGTTQNGYKKNENVKIKIKKKTMIIDSGTKRDFHSGWLKDHMPGEQQRWFGGGHVGGGGNGRGAPGKHENANETKLKHPAGSRRSMNESMAGETAARRWRARRRAR